MLASRTASPLVVTAALLAVALGTTPLGGCAPKRVVQPDARTLDAAAPAAPLVRRQGTTRREVPAPGAAQAPGLAAPDGAAEHPGLKVAGLALGQLGRPYRWGGAHPQRGFDCSGLVQWSYRNVGVDLPRVVGDQRRVGRSVEAQHLQPGDLVFFNLHGNRTSHVGIYIGRGQFVHAPRVGQPVRTDSLLDSWWHSRWTDARRILDY